MSLWRVWVLSHVLFMVLEGFSFYAFYILVMMDGYMHMELLCYACNYEIFDTKYVMHGMENDTIETWETIKHF